MLIRRGAPKKIRFFSYIICVTSEFFLREAKKILWPVLQLWLRVVIKMSLITQNGPPGPAGPSFGPARPWNTKGPTPVRPGPKTLLVRMGRKFLEGPGPSITMAGLSRTGRTSLAINRIGRLGKKITPHNPAPWRKKPPRPAPPRPATRLPQAKIP